MSKKNIILCMLLACGGHFLVDVMIGIWPVYKTMAHLDLALAGAIGAICAFAGEGLQVLFGSLSDRGYRRSLILAGLLATTATLFLAYTDNYWWIFFFFLCTCAGSGAFHPCAVSLVSDLSTVNKGFFIALFTSSGAFGMALSQILFTSFHHVFDGQVLYLCLPALGLILFSLCLRIGKSPNTQNTSAGSHFNLKVFAQFFRFRPLRLLYFSQVCNASLLWGLLFLLPDMLLSRSYDSWIVYGGGHMIFICGSALMMIPAGYLADRFSPRQVILASMIMGMFCFYSILFFPLLNTVTLLILLFSLGATLGVVQPVAISFGTVLAPNHKGMVSALLMGLVWCVSEGIGQGGAGYLATCFTEDAPAKALGILGMLFVVGATLANMLPENEEVTIEEVAERL